MKARLRYAIAWAADGELLPGSLAVVSDRCRTLPAGLIIEDTGIREDIPAAALIRTAEGGYSWVKASALQPLA